MSRHTKLCIVCGRAFECPPSAKTITCSPECRRARARAVRHGNPWPEAAKAKLGARGQTPNLKLGTPAAQLSPIAGPYPANQEAKIWWVRSLDTGARYRVRNLRDWCRDHPELFAPDSWHHAYRGLLAVQHWLTGGRTRQVSRWKGWTLDRPGVYPDEAEQS